MYDTFIHWQQQQQQTWCVGHCCATSAVAAHARQSWVHISSRACHLCWAHQPRPSRCVCCIVGVIAAGQQRQQQPLTAVKLVDVVTVAGLLGQCANTQGCFQIPNDGSNVACALWVPPCAVQRALHSLFLLDPQACLESADHAFSRQALVTAQPAGQCSSNCIVSRSWLVAGTLLAMFLPALPLCLWWYGCAPRAGGRLL